MKVRFMRPIYFLWVVVPVVGFIIYMVWGLPHVIWSYDFRAASYDPLAERYYERCTYVGPYGTFTIYPTNGKCRWIRFLTRSG